MKYKFLLFTLALFTISFVSAQSIGIVGPAANGWPDASNPTPDIMLTDNGDGTHSIEALQLSDGLAKFRTDQDWSNPDYGGNSFPTGNAIVSGPDINVTAGIYDITLDLNNNTYEFVSVAPSMAPPAPTENAANVVSIYSDAYTDVPIENYDPFWGQPVDPQVNTMVDVNGDGSNFVMSYIDFTYQGTQFDSDNANAIDLSDMDFLHVDIWVPAGTDRQVRVSPINFGTGPSEVQVEVPLTPGSWNSVTLPKSAFTDGGGAEMTWDAVNQMIFNGQFNADGTANTTPFDIYLDNIYFSETPTSTTTDYTFNITDSFGDGWNGNEMEVLENGTVVETLGPQLDAGDGTSATVTVTLDVGAKIELDWSTVGSFEGEVGVSIVSANGSTLFDMGSGNGNLAGESLYRSNVTDDDCAPSYNTSTSNIGFASADINWLASVDEDGGYEWYVVPTGMSISDAVDSGTVAAGILSASTSNLSATTTYDVYISSICGGSTGIANNFHSFTTLSNCLPPNNFTVDNSTTNTIDLSWDDFANASNGYEVLVFAEGDDPDNDTAVTTESYASGVTTATVTGLSENTAYEVYIKSICSGTEESDLSPAVAFTTPCAAVAAPYSENFDGGDWTPGTGFSNDGSTIADCWSRTPETSADFFWGTRTADTGSGTTGPSDDVTGGGNYVFTEASNGSQGDEAFLELPPVDLSALSAPSITFFYHMYGADMGTLSVEVKAVADANYTEVFSISGQQQTDNGDAFIEQLVDLNAFSGQTVNIRFKGVKGPDFESDIAIDEVSVDEAPACPKPSGLAVTNIQSNNASFSWDAVGNATNGYEVQVFDAGADPDNDTPVATEPVASGMTTATVSGLSENSPYDAYVKALCSGTDESDLSFPVSFTTLCNPIAAPYSENFDGTDWVAGSGFDNDGDAIADCWIREPAPDDGDPYSWGTGSGETSSSDTGPDDDVSGGGNYIFTEGSDGTTGDVAFMNLPILDLSALSAPSIQFDFHMYGSDIGSLSVEVKEVSAGSYTEVFSISGQQQSDISDDFINQIIDLNAFAGQTVNIRFVGEKGGTGNSADIAVDGISVDELPACIPPANINESNLTSTSFDISWDDTSTASNGYEWVLMADGDAPDPATALQTDTTMAGMTSASVTGLTAATGYSFYVRSDCGSEFSDWSGALNVFTPPANDDICDAIDLSVGSVSAPDAYTTVGASVQTGEPDMDGNANGGITNTVWFTFTAPASGRVLISTDIPGGTLTDTEIALYEEPTDCTDASTMGAFVAFDQDGGEDVNFNSVIVQSGLTPGDTYYIQVDRWNTASNGTFGIEIQDDPTADVQLIHNSADPAAQFVDVYLNGTLAFDDVEFRTATPFIEVPAGEDIDLDVAPQNSTDVSESIYNLNTNLDIDETYVAVADGVIDPTQFDQSVNTIDFGLEVFAGAQQTSTNAGEVSVLVHHGSTDAPTVDVVNDADQSILVDDISYTEFDGYLDLPTQDYTINVEAADNSAVVQSYEAPLQTLGLSDAAVTVVASGFLDPAANQNGEAFGLWVALPAGGDLVPLPEAQDDTAEVQLIHNAADPNAEFVDVYLNGTLVADDFEFRTASDFLEVPAEQAIDIDIAPQSSTDVSESIYNLNTTLTADETYVAVANGVLDPSQFDSSVNTIAFGIDVFAGAQQSSTNAGETSVLVHHGSTDAPMVDIVNDADQSVLVDDISYTEFDGYLDLPTADYIINVEAADNSSVVASYAANLQTLGLADSAITVVASGFLDPSANQNGADFGLWAALPSAGPLVELTETIGTDEFADNNFSYYPNPVEQRLNLNTNGLVEDVTIYNMLGQEVLDVQPEQESPQINMSGLQSGAYMMKVSIDGATQTFRLIKK